MTLEKLLKDFEKYKINIEGRNQSTLNRYIEYISRFFKDMEINTYEDLIKTDHKIIKDWLNMLSDDGDSKTTRNNRLSAVKQIFLYLENELDVEVDRKISKIKFAKTEIKERRHLTPEEVHLLLRSMISLRIKVGATLMWETGMRFSEMIQVSCQDVYRGYTIVKGKGGKERKIPLSPSCTSLCKRFIETKRKKIIDKYGYDTDILMITDKGSTISLAAFNKSLKKSAKKMGLYWWEEMNSHILRHSFITYAIKKGGDIETIRDTVGHSNIATTNRYSHSKEDDIKEMMEKLWG